MGRDPAYELPVAAWIVLAPEFHEVALCPGEEQVIPATLRECSEEGKEVRMRITTKLLEGFDFAPEFVQAVGVKAFEGKRVRWTSLSKGRR